jgi:hypothetical protein
MPRGGDGHAIAVEHFPLRSGRAALSLGLVFTSPVDCRACSPCAPSGAVDAAHESGTGDPARERSNEAKRGAKTRSGSLRGMRYSSPTWLEQNAWIPCRARHVAARIWGDLWACRRSRCAHHRPVIVLEALLHSCSPRSRCNPHFPLTRFRARVETKNDCRE